ncbi:MAG: hypothetical protein M3P22_01015 [bacterium]|nr:hypothetical protein [bacterium]
MNIVTVIPLQKSVWKEELTYFSAKDIPNGNIVSISIRNKKCLALVVDSSPVNSMKSNIKGMDFNLKKINEIKEHSIWNNDFLNSVFSTARYFATNKSTAISALIPNIFKEEYDKISKFKNIKSNTNGSEFKNIKSEKLLFQMNIEDRISIYKTMIRSHFAEKKSVFVVLPTEIDIDKFHQYLSKGIENFCFKMHSSMKKSEILKNYEQIVTSEHPIIIFATPTFLCMPRYDINTIIIENEHSNAYRMMMKPHFDMRTYAEIYASNIGAKLILSDNLLRYETLARKETENMGEVYPLSFRINFEGKIQIIGPDLIEKKGAKFKILKDETIIEIKDIINQKKNVFIFSLRKGLATQTICKDCNDILLCTDCNAPVVLYNSKNETKRMFVCNRCKKEIDSNTTCRLCGSWNLLPLGIGVDTVYEELSNLLQKENIKILRLDKDIAKNKKDAEKIIIDFENEKGAILIGTEIALFYLQNKVPLSVIASFDSLWSIPNYKMGERIIEIMLSVIEKTKDKFIVQTKNDKDSVVLGFSSNNLVSFVREELEDRKNLEYPPYKRFIKISYTGDKKDISNIKKILEEKFKNYNPEIFSGFITKSKEKYNINMLITTNIRDWSLPEIIPNGTIDQNLFELISSLPPFLNIYVDPENLL